ncbi:MAG: thymidylate synthase [Longimicrobiaceae bacterium]
MITEPNLSVAWIRAMDAALDGGAHELAPLVLTVTGFGDDGSPEEVPAVRGLVDQELARVWAAEEEKKKRREMAAKGKSRAKPTKPLTCHTVANTIFPASLWNPDLPREKLYERFQKIYPALKRQKGNQRGTYFHRLVKYPDAPEGGNQLECIIKMFRDGLERRSAFQAPITYPKKDMVASPLLGFPCLQQVAFTPNRKQGTLAVTGFYGKQYMLERAYGNYLGLARLGHFMAVGMGLQLERMTCIAAVGEIEVGAGHARELVRNAKEAARLAGVMR